MINGGGPARKARADVLRSATDQIAAFDTEWAAAQHNPIWAAQLLLDQSPNAVIAIDTSGVIRYVNPCVTTLFGYEAHEVCGRSVEVLIPDRFRVSHVRHRAGFAAHPHSRPMGTSLTLAGARKDGSEFPVEVTIGPVETDDGTWAVAMVADVSARHAAETRVQVLSRAYLTLARTNQAIVRAADATAVFDEICRIAVDTGDYLGACVRRPAADGSLEIVATAGDLGDYITGVEISQDAGTVWGRGPTAVALRESRTYYCSDYLADEATTPWRDRAAPFGIRASAALPLRCGRQTVAVLTLYSAEPDVFDEQMCSLLESMAENVSFALDGFDAERRLREVAAQRSELLHRLVAAQELERASIAADVHDDSVQVLAAADLRLRLLERKTLAAAPELRDEVVRLQELLASATGRLRQLLFDLESPDADVSLVEAIERAAAHIFDGTCLMWTVHGSDRADLPAAERTQAVRVVKEALTNARDHARATHVAVSVTAVDGGVELAVVDDGVGLPDGTTTSPPGHRGLTTMRDRAEISGGWFRVGVPAGGGTAVRFWLPGRGDD